jgi:hypothetical protein
MSVVLFGSILALLLIGLWYLVKPKAKLPIQKSVYGLRDSPAKWSKSAIPYKQYTELDEHEDAQDRDEFLADYADDKNDKLPEELIPPMQRKSGQLNWMANRTRGDANSTNDCPDTVYFTTTAIARQRCFHTTKVCSGLKNANAVVSAKACKLCCTVGVQ